MHRRHDRRQAVPTHSADEAEYGPARSRAPVTLTALDTEGAHAVLSAAAAQLGAAVTLLRERDPLVAEAGRRATRCAP
jgi:hypothetical protein